MRQADLIRFVILNEVKNLSSTIGRLNYEIPRHARNDNQRTGV